MEIQNLDSLHCFVEIVDGIFEEGNSIIIEYYLNAGSEWKNQSIIQREDQSNSKNRLNRSRVSDNCLEKIHGCTRKSIRDSNNRCTFNHLFELNFEFDKQEIVKSNQNENLSKIKSEDDSSDEENKTEANKIEKVDKVNQEDMTDHEIKNFKNDTFESKWPHFELRVWSIDEWKRKIFIGLAFLNLPQKPGTYLEKIDIWSLNPNQPKDKLIQYFLGYSLEPKTKLIDKNDWRLSMNGQVIGCISMRLNLVVCKHIPSHLELEEIDAIEEKIQRVVVAFRDARRRMQSLLKEKENII